MSWLSLATASALCGCGSADELEGPPSYDSQLTAPANSNDTAQDEGGQETPSASTAEGADGSSNGDVNDGNDADSNQSPTSETNPDGLELDTPDETNDDDAAAEPTQQPSEPEPPASTPPDAESDPPVEPTPPSDIPIRPARPEGFGEAVTGGAGGSVVTATTGTEIHRAICDREADDTPLIILVDGVITPDNTLQQSGSCNTADGLLELKEISNISLIGVGESGILDQVGVHIRSSSNIIIQNLTIRNVRKENTDTPSNGGDAIGMEADVQLIWIDHNLIHGSTIEGEEHDGLIDMKDNTRDVTISYNHLHTSGRGGLVASNDDGDDGSTRITWHHNWYENLNSRTHLVREAHGHFYNNYYTQIRSTGINARNGATLLIEGNFFEESRNPLGTFFFIENPGVYQLNANIFTESVVWEAGDEVIPAGPSLVSTGSVSVPYEYSLDPAEQTPAIVTANAGVGKL